jgi:mannosyltransferase
LIYIIGSTSRRSLLTTFLLIAVLAGIAFRFVDLGGKSLWTDEMMTVDSALIGEDMPAAYVFGVLQGPLMALLMRVWGGISMAEGFLRFPFALAGCLTVAAAYMLSRFLSGPWISLNTAFFVSLSPMLIWYSQEVRGYAFFVLFTVLMTYYLVQWIRSHKNRHLFLYGLFLFAGLLSNLSAAFVAASHFIYLIALPDKRRLLGRWVVSILVVMLFFSPWVRTVLLKTDVERVVSADSGEPPKGGAEWSALAVPYMLFTYSVGYTLGPPLRSIQTRGAAVVTENLHWVIATGAVFCIPLVVGLRRLRQDSRDLLFLLLVWLIVPVTAVVVLSLRNVRIFTPRYALVSLPPYALIVGRGLAAITKSRWWPVTIAFAALLAVSLFNYFLRPVYGKDDAQGVASTIREHFEPGDTVVAILGARPLTHYLGDFADVTVFEAGDMESRQAMESRCREIASGAQRVWLSLCREWIVDSEGVIRSWFDENMALVRSFEFPGMRLYLYAKRSG